MFQADDLIIERTSDPKEKPAETNLVFGSTMADHMLMVDWCNTSGWGIPRIVPYGPLSVMPSASVFHYGLEVSINLDYSYNRHERFGRFSCVLRNILGTTSEASNIFCNKKKNFRGYSNWIFHTQ